MSQKFCTECSREELRTGDHTVCMYCGGQLTPAADKSKVEGVSVIGDFRSLVTGRRGYSWDADVPVSPTNPVPMTPDPHLWVSLEICKQIEQDMKKYDDERRLKAVYVPELFLFDIYVFPTRVPDHIAVLDAEPLPPGTEVLPGPHHDRLSRCFIYFVRHPTFDVVPDGEQVPRWPSLCRFRMVRTVSGDGVSESSAPE